MLWKQDTEFLVMVIFIWQVIIKIWQIYVPVKLKYLKVDIKIWQVSMIILLWVIEEIAKNNGTCI